MPELPHLHLWFMKYRQSKLARNTFWMFLGQGLRVLLQAGTFILIARGLGARNYGAFVSVAALVAVFAPFTSVGFGNLLIKNIARDKSLFREYWGNVLLLCGASSVFLTALVLAVSRFLVPREIPIHLILLLAGADLLAARVIDVAGQAFQALEQLYWTAKINVLSAMLMLLGAVAAVGVWKHPSPLQWGYVYFGSLTVACIVAVVMVSVRLGFPRISLHRVRAEFREGLYFSISLSAQTIYNEIDKSMLARLATLEAAGIYAAAYRLIDAAFIPVRSSLAAAYPGFFRAGHEGIRGTIAYMRALISKLLTYATLAFCGLLLLAPLASEILGGQYRLTVEAVRWLAPLVLLKTMHYLLSDSLTGAGYQKQRTVLQLTVAVINVVLNLWLIPAYSWRGASWASLMSDGVYLIGCSILVVVFAKSAASGSSSVQQFGPTASYHEQ